LLDRRAGPTVAARIVPEVPGPIPNFALRRATVVLAALLVVGGGLGFALSRCEGDDTGGQHAESAQAVATAWDVVVLDDPLTDVITVHDITGAEVARASTDLQGVLDVGLAGLVVLGTAGDPAADGLGVLDLANGTITPIEIDLPVVDRLGASPYLLASDPATGALRLVDVPRRRVIDLLPIAGDDAVVVPDTVRVSRDATLVAFSELRSGQTVVVDLTDSTDNSADTDPLSSVALPGLLADLTDTRVATTTNRGTTMLVDLYDTAGTRLGTTETVPLVGVMVVDDTTLTGIANDASVVQIDAAAGSADVSTALRDRVQDLLGDAASAPIAARSAQVVFDHRRLVTVGDGWSAIVDDAGEVVSAATVGSRSTSIDAASPSQRCVLVFGSPSEPSTLFDTSTGAIIASFDPSVPIGASVDGCTVARQGFGTAPGAWRGYRVVGPDLDIAPTERVVALAPDGSAAIVSSGGTALLRFDSDTTVPLSTTTPRGAFARRAG
jgi:hypothetical protein